jgi:hypothetical protein
VTVPSRRAPPGGRPPTVMTLESEVPPPVPGVSRAESPRRRPSGKT